MDKFRLFLLKDFNLVFISVGIFILTFSAILLFKLTNKIIIWKKTGFFLLVDNHFTTKKITYVSMMIAVSVSTVVVITLIFPLTVLPPIRIAFEGIMIKIAGIIFGPIIGIFVGVFTELITILFVPSYIHIGYFLVAILFGFWGGICNVFFSWKQNKQYLLLIIITFIMFLIIIFFNWILNGIKIEANNSKIFGFQISPKLFKIVIIGMNLVTLVLIWILYITLTIIKKNNWIKVILPIILLCILNEVFASIIVAAWGDTGLFNIKDESGYLSLIVTRVVQMPIKVIFNSILITIIFLTIKPLIKIKY